MFNVFVAIALLFVGGSGLFWYHSAQPQEDSRVSVQSEKTEDIRVYSENETNVLFSEDEQSAQLSLPGVTDVVYSLNKVITETGIEYRSADGNILFSPESGTVSVREESTADVPVAQDEKTNRDPSAAKYDDVANGVDEDCDDTTADTKECNPGDPIPGIDITVEQGGEIDALDDDDDNDSLLSETELDASIDVIGQTDSEKATDYNSSRSNKSY